MNKKETIARLCDLVTIVGNKVYKHQIEHDCFCHGAKGVNVHPEIIAFIINAVNEKINKGDK